MKIGCKTFVAVGLALALTSCAGSPPVTLIERAIEARSAGNIVEDNRIVIDVNGIMADIGSIDASTEIYEQRLLITGLFDNKATYDTFRKRVRGVKGVKQLYWHADYMSKAEQTRRENELLGWAGALTLDTKIETNMLAARGVANVNFRSAVDAFGTVYLLGRARSTEELKKALAVVKGTEGVKRVVNYAIVRP